MKDQEQDLQSRISNIEKRIKRNLGWLSCYFGKHYSYFNKFYEVLDHFEKSNKIEMPLNVFKKKSLRLNVSAFSSFCDLLINTSYLNEEEFNHFHDKVEPMRSTNNISTCHFYDLIAHYCGIDKEKIVKLLDKNGFSYPIQIPVQRDLLDLLIKHKESPNKDKFLDLCYGMLNYLQEIDIALPFEDFVKLHYYDLESWVDEIDSRDNVNQFNSYNFIIYYFKIQPKLKEHNSCLEESLSFKEINILAETYNLVNSVFTRNNYSYNPEYRDLSVNQFMNYLNQLVTLDEDIPEIKNNIFSWCNDVKRLIKKDTCEGYLLEGILLQRAGNSA